MRRQHFYGSIFGILFALVLASFPSAARANDYVFYAHSSSYTSLQIDQDGTLFAVGEGAWWLERNPEMYQEWDSMFGPDLKNMWEIKIVYELWVDGILIGQALAHEAQFGTTAISRSPLIPDVIPFSFETQLSPGWHLIEFTCYYTAWDWSMTLNEFSSLIEDTNGSRFYHREAVFVP